LDTLNNMYEIKQIQNKSEWEQFLQKQEFTPMTQSWKYGEFYKTQGEKFWCFGVYEYENLIAGAMVLSVHARRGNFLFVPYGPIITKDKKHVLQMITGRLKKLAEEKGYSFIRVSPFEDLVEETIYKEAGYRKAPIHILAETTWLLDLRADEKEMLMTMNKNHRNLIHRCQREGVRVLVSTHSKHLHDFNTLHDITAKRHHFVRFSDEYVAREFQAFDDDKEVLVLRAYLPALNTSHSEAGEPDGTLDSSAVVYYYSNMAAYRHGASLMQDKKLPTSYLLQWTAIQEAKKRGIRYYNFWGIAPEDAPKNHPFKGITHFKK